MQYGLLKVGRITILLVLTGGFAMNVVLIILGGFLGFVTAQMKPRWAFWKQHTQTCLHTRKAVELSQASSKIHTR